ncbi:MAG: hypothetical protein WCJ56_09245 [bacterium]
MGFTEYLHNQKQLTTALQIYVQENNGPYPPAQWVQTSTNIALDVTSRKVLVCPTAYNKQTADDKLPICYGYNGELIKVDGTGVTEKEILAPTMVAAFADVALGRTIDAPGIINGGGCRSDNMVNLVYRHENNHAIIVSYVDGHIKRFYAPPNESDINNPVNQGLTSALGLGYLNNPGGGIYTRPNVSAPVAPCSVTGEYSTRMILGAAAELMNMKAAPESENRVTMGEFVGETAGEADDSAVTGSGANLPGPGAVVIARDAVVVISAKGSAIKMLKSSELKNYWGTKHTATSYTYDGNSGTRSFFYQKIGLPKNHRDRAATIALNDYDMVQKVAADPDGIGYCSAAFADPNLVDIVAIDGIGFPNPNADAGPETKYLWPAHAPTGNYPYMRTLYAQPSENPSAGARDFMEKLPVLLRAVQQGPLFKMSYYLP